MPDERESYYVATIPTREHPKTVYLAVDADRDGTTAWYITDDPSKANAFADPEARLLASILKGEHTGENVYNIVDPERRPWHVVRREFGNGR